MSNMEMKSLSVPFELKELNDEGVFSGYGAVFNNIDGGGDIIDPDAFKSTIKEHSEKGKLPKMLWQHDPSKVIGVWSEMSTDDRGLKVSGRLLTELPLAKEAHVLMKNKAIDGLSIGYQTVRSEADTKGVRRLKELKLWEVSVVTFPMNAEALVSDVKQIESIRAVERILRDAGVPSKFAKLVAAHGFDEAKAILDGEQRDADSKKEAERLVFDQMKQQLKAMKEILNA